MKLQYAWIKWDNDIENRIMRGYALMVRNGDCTHYQACKDLLHFMPRRTYNSIYSRLQRLKRYA